MRIIRIPMILSIATSLALPAIAPAAAAVRASKAGKTFPGAKARKPPSPAAKAVAIQIGVQIHGPSRRFYADRGYWPLWAAEGRIGREAGAFVAILATADRDGLKPADYGPARLREQIDAAQSGEPAAVAAAEISLSNALAKYVADVRRPPKVDMKYLDAALKPRRLKAEEVLTQAALPMDFAAYIGGMGWMNPQYQRLRRLAGLALEAGTSKAEMTRLALNLDRARLLPGPWVRHIVVDAARAQLFYYQGGAQVGTMRVVVGTPETPTPMLAGVVRYAILNPYWNVPVDLVQRRIAPKIVAGDPLRANRYEALSDWTASAKRIDLATIDWPAVASGRREVRLRQLPGGDNAMGRAKFMFPNDQGIYLHDTPDKALIKKPTRFLSNGCVRLEDAPRLGRWLLGKPLAKPGGKPEQAVPLEQPVPVYLTYITATPTERGLGFLPDPYGRD